MRRTKGKQCGFVTSNEFSQFMLDADTITIAWVGFRAVGPKPNLILRVDNSCVFFHTGFLNFLCKTEMRQWRQFRVQKILGGHMVTSLSTETLVVLVVITLYYQQLRQRGRGGGGGGFSS